MEGLLNNPQLVGMAKKIMENNPGLVKQIKKSLRKGGKKRGGTTKVFRNKRRSYRGGMDMTDVEVGMQVTWPEEGRGDIVGEVVKKSTGGNVQVRIEYDKKVWKKASDLTPVGDADARDKIKGAVERSDAGMAKREAKKRLAGTPWSGKGGDLVEGMTVKKGDDVGAVVSIGEGGQIKVNFNGSVGWHKKSELKSPTGGRRARTRKKRRSRRVRTKRGGNKKLN